ncbi:hypothetical protein FBQ82_00570 [Anaerolineae bacterium CFX7]|nr:hypothetical protein [Anaerolineae bacterium CFX7]
MSDLVCVGIAVRVNVLVSVALGVLVGSSVGEFVKTSDEIFETRVCVANDSLLLHPANINTPNSTNRKMTRRIKFLLDDYGKRLQQSKQEPWFQDCACAGFQDCEARTQKDFVGCVKRNG